MVKRRENPQQDSNKKLRVKKNEEKEKKKKSGKKKRENMAEIGACINKPSFPSLFSKPTLWNPISSNK